MDIKDEVVKLNKRYKRGYKYRWILFSFLIFIGMSLFGFIFFIELYVRVRAEKEYKSKENNSRMEMVSLLKDNTPDLNKSKLITMVYSDMDEKIAHESVKQSFGIMNLLALFMGSISIVSAFLLVVLIKRYHLLYSSLESLLKEEELSNNQIHDNLSTAPPPSDI